MKVSIIPYTLKFLRPAGTSRGVMNDRKTWILVIEDEQGRKGLGEIAPLPGLSPEYDDLFERSLEYLQQANDATSLLQAASRMSSLQFAWETAMLDLSRGGKHVLFPGMFTEGKFRMKINGLIWMGDKDFMLEQVKQKLQQGFSCLKMKVGAIGLEDEKDVLSSIRKIFSKDDLEIRLDANGAFPAEDALSILEDLSQFHIHSIEQPIATGQIDKMASLCASSPIPVALDEELIGIHNRNDKQELLEHIKPHYIILKPSLHGGITGCDDWIMAANGAKASWWITSALESNIGLNAIAQYAASKGVTLPQGLGTGQLYETNFACPLVLEGEWMRFEPEGRWDLSAIGL